MNGTHLPMITRTISTVSASNRAALGIVADKPRGGKWCLHFLRPVAIIPA